MYYSTLTLGTCFTFAYFPEHYISNSKVLYDFTGHRELRHLGDMCVRLWGFFIPLGHEN